MQPDKKKIILTGASGFIGARYLEYNKDRYQIIPVSLRETSPSSIDFEGIDTIVHLAGKAHQMVKIDDEIYFDVNYRLTQEFAAQAKKAGVPHFIFMSTLKVYGENGDGRVFYENTQPIPVDPYGISKLKAEEAVLEMADDAFRVAIVRPPLVYGPGVKGNMIRFLHLADKPYPLPFKGIDNLRSMVFLDNLIELVNQITDARASGVFLASDEKPISTSTLIGLMRKHMGKKPGLFKLSNIVLFLLRTIRPELVRRLYESFVVDNTATNRQLQFNPPFTTEEGVRQMVNWYLKDIKPKA